MFSCFLQTTRSSGLKKDNSSHHDGVWRHRLQSCLKNLWPFSKRGNNLTKASQEMAHTDLVTTLFSLGVWPRNKSGNLEMRRTYQMSANLCQFDPSTLISFQDEKVSAQKYLVETRTESCIRAQTDVEQMNTLVPALNEWDPLVVIAFLSTYRSFATPLQVLDLLFVR